MEKYLYLALAALAGYLLGSINFSILLSRAFHKQDIRSLGSKNAGATNMLRSFGPRFAAYTVLGDGLKTVAACLAGAALAGTEAGGIAAGTACILGHCYPLYFRFKGGKGVMTLGALSLMVDYRLGLIGIGVFVIVSAVTNYVSLGSILGALSFAVAAMFMRPEQTWFILWACAIFGFITIKHKENIGRIINGTERKLISSKQKN